MTALRMHWRLLAPRPLPRRRAMAVAALTGTLGVGALSAVAQPAQAAPNTTIRDGLSAQTAAASCWEIKSNFPEKPDGIYWLQTPTLIVPQQFWCDQTTDGGGWVLVGRGREGWGFGYGGQGKSIDVTTPTGQAAFAPRALAARTIDGLLDGGRVDALPDGIRLRRATVTNPTTAGHWQESRLRLGDRDRWVWAFGGGMSLAGWSVNGATKPVNGGTTASVGTDNAYQRISTTSASAEGYRPGFAYGNTVAGLDNTSSYVWKTGSGRAVPFTQVYLRPKLLSGDLTYSNLPDSGAPATTVRRLPDNASKTQTWGVSGSANGSGALFDDEVHAFTQATADRMIVGGNFQFVENPTAGRKVEQSYLAAFDVDTADWLSDFRPTFDGQVLALATLPNGDVVAGGEFKTVNGRAVPGIVALDPETGQIDNQWQVQLEQRSTGSRLFVRALAVHGGWLYIGGSFSHLSGGGSNPAYARNAARVDLQTAQPDRSWRPAFDGSVNAISLGNGRVYLAGWFHNVSGRAAERVAVLSAADASLVPGLASPTFSAKANYQQAIAVAGDSVWYGGSEHMLFQVDAATFARQTTNITRRGGDFQVITPYDGLVFASCHCNQYTYAGADTYPTTNTNQVDNINFVGAWDADTGAYIPDFLPSGLATRAGHGAWAIQPDSRGTLWVGGDFTHSRNGTGATQWNGGFFRLGVGDNQAPATPGNLATRRTNAGQLELTWTASTDDSGRALTYEVIADDRVIAVKGGVSAVFDMPTTTTNYFVRAVDRSGNRSATTAAQTAP
ncbi:MAG: hypothetical protein H0V48_06745 [Nocardioidaceae bacterium]|nr:hypothetical protein [Nocardioidaceae bacterium]